MLDSRQFRGDRLEALAAALARRGTRLNKGRIRDLEAERKRLQTELEALRAEHKRHSQEAMQNARQADLEARRNARQRMASLALSLQAVQTEFQELLETIPNVPDASAPDGGREQDNQCLRRWGTVRTMDFPVRDHVFLGEALGGLHLQAAARMSGARFAVLSGALAQLHRALVQFMLDIHIRRYGYTEINAPCLIQAHSCFGTGQLPKFAEDLFYVPEQELYLSPTGEVPVTNLVREQILDGRTLPRRYVCHSVCFRSEAGSHGKDVRGLIRQHQFEKVELVQLCRAQESRQLLEELTEHAEAVLQALELPYRVMTLCAGELGFSAAKTYDLEVWLPGQDCYREISSCSNFTDFQARRLKARWREPGQGKKTEFLHTLNGSALAVGRTLVAVLENGQDREGCIALPEALHPYMNGTRVLKPPA